MFARSADLRQRPARRARAAHEPATTGVSVPLIVLNFTHPLTDDQLAALRELTAAPFELRSATSHMLPDQTPEQVAQLLADAVGLSAQEWQTLPLLVNLPGHATIAAALIAELHGRCGYFPTVLLIRPRPDSAPPRFDLTGLLNLQQVRDQARRQR